MPERCPKGTRRNKKTGLCESSEKDAPVVITKTLPHVGLVNKTNINTMNVCKKIQTKKVHVQIFLKSSKNSWKMNVENENKKRKTHSQIPLPSTFHVALFLIMKQIIKMYHIWL